MTPIDAIMMTVELGVKLGMLVAESAQQLEREAIAKLKPAGESLGDAYRDALEKRAKNDADEILKARPVPSTSGLAELAARESASIYDDDYEPLRRPCPSCGTRAIVPRPPETKRTNPEDDAG